MNRPQRVPAAPFVLFRVTLRAVSRRPHSRNPITGSRAGLGGCERGRGSERDADSGPFLTRATLKARWSARQHTGVDRLGTQEGSRVSVTALPERAGARNADVVQTDGSTRR